MLTLSGIPATSYAPNLNQVKSPAAAPPQQPAAPLVQPVQSVGKDADGDNDSSRGGKIDVYA